MMLVDSGVWIDFLAARSTPQTDYLKLALHEQRILSADLVIAEVLQGVRDDRAFAIACEQLTALDIIEVVGREVAILAAQHYRLLRAMGITIRKTIDTLIAARCIADRIPLLYADRDFDPFVEHLGLRSAMSFPIKVN